MLPPRSLQLQLNVTPGREAACADAIWAQVPERERPVLAALAAELVSRHEAAMGSRVILAPAAAADRVLADLLRSK